MKKTPLWAAFGGALAATAVALLAAVAQDAGEEKPVTACTPQPIGFLDVKYVYEHYPRFNEQIAELKTDMGRAEEEVKQKKEAIKTLQEQLQQQATASAEYAELEKRLAAGRAELAASVETQKKVFTRREARLYYDAYQKILKEVEDYAAARNLALVLLVRDAAVNVGEPKEVLQRINHGVVWYDRERDLTRIILQRLTQQSPPSETPEDEAS